MQFTQQQSVQKSVGGFGGQSKELRRLRLESTGRDIDISCPFEGECFGNMGCVYGNCPPTLLDVLRSTAELEHDVGFVPHTDPEIKEVCQRLSCKVRLVKLTHD